MHCPQTLYCTVLHCNLQCSEYITYITLYNNTAVQYSALPPYPTDTGSTTWLLSIASPLLPPPLLLHCNHHHHHLHRHHHHHQHLLNHHHHHHHQHHHLVPLKESCNNISLVKFEAGFARIVSARKHLLTIGLNRSSCYNQRRCNINSAEANTTRHTSIQSIIFWQHCKVL